MNDRRSDILISRFVSNDMTDGEWREFVAAAESDPPLWREAVLAQRDQQAVEAAVDGAAAAAEKIQICAAGPSGSALARLRAWPAWAGWAAAACLSFVILQIRNPRAGENGLVTGPVQHASLGPAQSAADAFQAYLSKGQESGQVIGEVPTRVLLESRPAASGQGYELVFMRQVLERAVVPDLYSLGGHDELGQPTFVKYSHPRGSSM